MYWTENKRALFLCILLTVGLAGAGNYLPATQLLNFVAVSVGLFVLLTGSIESDCYLLIALIPFYKSLAISGFGVGFLFPFLAVLKLIFEGHVKINVGMLLFFDVVLIFILHDYDETSIGKIINFVSYVLYAGIASFSIDVRKYDYKFALLVFLSSIIFAQIAIFIVQGGDINVFYEEVGMRLGEGKEELNQKNLLGGAMGFPIYSMIVISSIIVYLKNNKTNLALLFIMSFIVLFEFFITFFTISKVYLLGLICFAMICVIYYIFKLSISRFFKFIFVGVSFFLLFLFLFQNHIDHFITTYEKRTIYAKDVSSGRELIYISSINYLSNNVYSLLIGEGRWGYQNIGERENLPFSKTAHNIVLDCVMIYGLFGMAVFVVAYSSLIQRLPHRRFDLLNFSPLICWFFMNMTTSTFIAEKNYIIVIPLLLNVFTCENKEAVSYEVVHNHPCI